MKNIINKKLAFTLSEVLITLGIIGTIAILTVPNLSNHYKEKSWNASADMFSERLSHAIYEMAQTGKMEGYTTTADFVNVLNNSMPLMQICDSDNLTECFTGSFVSGDDIIDTSELTTSQRLGRENYNTEVMGFRTKFGVNGIIAYDQNCSTTNRTTISGTPCLSYVIDTNGTNAPNKTGQDIRTFDVSFTQEEQASANCTQLGNYCVANFEKDYSPIDCQESNSGSEDYQYCGPHPSGYQNDYWAGAKKKCTEEGLELPTAEILHLLYTTHKDLEVLPSGWIWASQEGQPIPKTGARYVSSAYGEFSSNWKYYPNNKVLCIGQ